MARFTLLLGKLHMKHRPARSVSDSEMSPVVVADERLQEVSMGGETRMFAEPRFTVAVHKAIFYYNRIPPSVDIVPIGAVKTSFIAFFILFATFGWLYNCLWRYRIGRANRLTGSRSRTRSGTKIRLQSTVHQASKKGSRSIAISKFDNVGTGYKEEVYEFMDTCAAVKGQLRHVEDPDRARTLKLQLLTSEAPEVLGTPASTCSDHEDTSHSSATNHNELVELCLDVRKGLHRVQDPDEARKLKLQRLKEQEVRKSATDIRKQHEQAGFSRMWKPSY